MIGPEMRGAHRDAANDAATPTVSQQPQQTIRTLAHPDDPQRHWITQVRKQCEIRDAARRDPRVRVMPQIIVMKNAQPARRQNTCAARVQPQREVNFLHSIRDRQRNVTTYVEISLTP